MADRAQAAEPSRRHQRRHRAAGTADAMNEPSFSARLLHWFDKHGRHDLPWQHPREPYRVWLAEIML
ncbi:MAG: A/G-specific adenine glycosylase, partial [Stenotrophobium sp.]